MMMMMMMMIYMIKISHPQSNLFHSIRTVWLDRLDSRNWNGNPVDSNASARFYNSATRKSAQAKEM